MRIDRITGLLDAARTVYSPNRDDRPPGAEVELVVLHGISLPPGEFGGPWIERLFTNTLPHGHHPFFDMIEDLHVSAHLLIRRDGEMVQYVPFHERAWHAGASFWDGRTDVNDFSVGIELEGTDKVPYTDVQYDRLDRVLDALVATYPALTRDAVTGHSDIAPGRKTDPGPLFDWVRVRRA